MALRDLVPMQDLERYITEVSDLLFYYLWTSDPDAIEGFLYEYQSEFNEWCESEGVIDGESEW